MTLKIAWNKCSNPTKRWHVQRTEHFLDLWWGHLYLSLGWAKRVRVGP